jgi:hypothetical protein
MSQPGGALPACQPAGDQTSGSNLEIPAKRPVIHRVPVAHSSIIRDSHQGQPVSWLWIFTRLSSSIGLDSGCIPPREASALGNRVPYVR